MVLRIEPVAQCADKLILGPSADPVLLVLRDVRHKHWLTVRLHHLLTTREEVLSLLDLGEVHVHRVRVSPEAEEVGHEIAAKLDLVIAVRDVNDRCGHWLWLHPARKEFTK